MVKHSTASVFVLGRDASEWRLGLVWHPRFARWMLPGGHVEDVENPAQAAIREVEEETGLAVELLTVPSLAVPEGAPSVVPLPLWLVEQEVPPEVPRLPQPHVHVDHLFVAWASEPEYEGRGQHEFRWCGQVELAGLEMFDGSRRFAHAVFTNIDTLVTVDRTNGVADLASSGRGRRR